MKLQKDLLLVSNLYFAIRKISIKKVILVKNDKYYMYTLISSDFGTANPDSVYTCTIESTQLKVGGNRWETKKLRHFEF